MKGTVNATQEVIDAAASAYVGLAVSVPLVLAGILLTGSAYYFAYVACYGRWRH